MKWMILTATLLLAAHAASALEVKDSYAEAAANGEEPEDGDARLGYVTVTSGGATSLSFNATSIQNAVILGLFIIILGALLVPLFAGGLGNGGTGGGTGYGYGGSSGSEGYSSGGSYEQPAQSSGYNNYAKRSAEFMGPVLDALSSAYKKYEDVNERQ